MEKPSQATPRDTAVLGHGASDRIVECLTGFALPGLPTVGHSTSTWEKGNMNDLLDEPQYVLWLDFETTGLNPELDQIVEIGAAITDLDLNLKQQYHVLYRPDDNAHWDQAAYELHQNNGLLEQLALPHRAEQDWSYVEEDFMSFCDSYPPPMILAGYGVDHMERRWLENWFPYVLTALTYYSWDTSVVRRMVKTVRPDKVLVKMEHHRALMDVVNAMQEWKFYSNLMKMGHF